MRYKLIFYVVFAFATCLGFGQDINRAKEWHIKRAEKTEVQVSQEMKFNETAAPVGRDPRILNESGNPVSRRTSDTESMEEGDDQPASASAISKQSDRLVQNQFEIAGTVVDTPEKEKSNPVLVGSVFLIVGILVAVAFSVTTKKIKVPANL